MGSGRTGCSVEESVSVPDVVILYTTWPDAEKAEAIAAETVAERLCACVNVFAPIRSVYRWEGAVERAEETPVTFKTTEEAAPALAAFIAARHPYETPCILALRADAELSHGGYVEWVQASVAAPEASRDPDEPVSPEAE
jgi:periplasmic divalent cation tolerance protein